MSIQSFNLCAALATITSAEINGVEFYFSKFEKGRAVASRVHQYARQYPVIAGLVDPQNVREVECLPVGEDIRDGIYYVGFVLSVLAEHRAHKGRTSLRNALGAMPVEAFDFVQASLDNKITQDEIDSLFNFACETFPNFFLTLIEWLKTENEAGKMSDGFYTGAAAAAAAVVSAARGGPEICP